MDYLTPQVEPPHPINYHSSFVTLCKPFKNFQFLRGALQLLCRPYLYEMAQEYSNYSNYSNNFWVFEYSNNDFQIMNIIRYSIRSFLTKE